MKLDANDTNRLLLALRLAIKWEETLADANGKNPENATVARCNENIRNFQDLQDRLKGRRAR